jgi:ATP-dependent protease ClpP protease subunit
MVKRKRRFGEDSPFIKIRKEVGQTSELRQHLIGQLERVMDAKVVTFFTTFTGAGMISNEDAEMLESILSFEQDNRRLVLVLNSPGGQGLAAERIVNVCRSYSKNRFEVIVPHMAKSAATMICFGATAIHMSKTAELGPVDPQFYYKDDKGNDISISAEEYVRSYDTLLLDAASGEHPRIEPYLQQLQRYDSRLVEQLKSAQNLASDISVRLLQSGMMNGKTQTDIQKSIQVFLSQQRTSSHGRMIALEEARSCGLNVKEVDLQCDTWHIVWELYTRSNWCVSKNAAKLIESSESAVSA